MKTLKNLFFVLILALSVNNLHSQPPPNPDQNGNGSGVGNNTIPGGGAAPLSGSVALLLGLAAGYGGRKLYSIMNKH
ncbi:MAG: hypothetical protein PHU33_14440 [Bacteroidales bacterium]|nr:hypothetical protein [Bacteroidales bacterium]